jgi:hypothetical protein
MKRILYIATAALTLFISCKSKPGDDDGESSGKQLDQSAEMLQQFKPVIHGVWVKKNYIKKVLKTKSPLEAIDRVEGITTFVVDTTQIKGDKLNVPVNWNNHKAGELTLKFQPGKNTTTVMLGDDELSYTVKRNDTTLIVYHYDEKKHETTSDKYIKAFDKLPPNGIAYPMSYMINEGMMSGKYEGTDAAGKKVNMLLTDNGKVSGYPGLSTYFVQNDLGEKMGMDVLIFNKGTKEEQTYAFELKKKVLTMHIAKPNADSTEWVQDGLKMTLVKARR